MGKSTAKKRVKKTVMGQSSKKSAKSKSSSKVAAKPGAVELLGNPQELQKLQNYVLNKLENELKRIC